MAPKPWWFRTTSHSCAAAARIRTQRPGKHLAVHASELVVKPDFQILRRYRRPLLLRLEHTHRPALEDYVHRATRLGSSRSLNLRIGIIPHNVVFIALFALCAILSAVGIWDLLQSKHSVRRNYPILANIRFMLEKIRPEIRQYFLESETDGTPFNRSKRAVAYQRAKGALDKRPFGTQQD